MSSARVAVVVLLVAVAGCVLFNVLAYAGAARNRRRQPRRVPDDDEPSAAARAGAALVAFVTECGATVALLLATPLGIERRPRRGGAAPARRPILLVHGYAQHPANFLSLGRRLRRDGWTHVYTLRHTPMFGDIERSAARLGAAIDRIRDATGAPAVDVIAHSMGGLVARAYIRARGSACGIARLVTLGTPHQGTQVFRRLAHDPMLVQMRPDSVLLRRLASDDPVPALVECVAIYSTGDAVVVPPHNGYYKGAFNIELAGAGHMSLLFSRRVYDLVRENLEAPLEATRAAAASS